MASQSVQNEIESSIWRDASPFVVRCLNTIEADHSLPALDLPCGNGRHCRLLSNLGFYTVGADIDPRRLANVNKPPMSATTNTVRLDAQFGLPFRHETFGLALVVHFVQEGIISAIGSLLAGGGYLIFETFGFNGDNWMQLPQAGEIRTAVQKDFEILAYREHRPKSSAESVVSVRLLARKF